MTTTFTAARRLVLSLSLAAGLVGCASASQRRYENQRQRVENATPPYDPVQVAKPRTRHVAVFFDIVDGDLRLSPRPAQLRPGAMPYRTATGGPVSVIYRSADGKELGRYGMDDPVVARSCDLETTKRAGLKPILRGEAEILLPADPRIVSLEIAPRDGKARTFDVSGPVGEGIRGAGSGDDKR